MKLFVLVLAVLASPAVSQGPLDGSYTSDDHACDIQLELRYLNFMAMRGPCTDGSYPGVFIGTYDIEPNDPDATEGTLTLFYTSVIGGSDGPMPGQEYYFTWIKLENGNLNLSTPMFGGHTTLYTLVDATPLAGTWGFNINGVTSYSWLSTATFVSFAYVDSSNVSVSIGSYEVSSKKKLLVYYADNDAGLENSYANGTYSIANNKITLNVFIQALRESMTMTGMMTQSNAALEGTWSGVAAMDTQGAYCLASYDFSGNFWRSFLTHCSPDAPLMFGTFMGNFRVVGNTLYLTYGYAEKDGQGSGLVGGTFPFLWDVSYERMTTLVLTSQPGGPDSPITTLTKTS